MTDAESIVAAEAFARGGETAQAVERLWALLREFGSRPVGKEARYADRRAALELLAVLSPDSVDVACALARLLLPDDAKAAWQVMQSTLRIVPHSLQVLRVLAEVQHLCGDVPKAVETYANLLAACRTAIDAGHGQLSERQKPLLNELRVYMQYGLYEKADDHLRQSGMLEGDLLDEEVHFAAAALARPRNGRDRGTEHEIFGLILAKARGRETKRLFDAARAHYPQLTLLVPLEERLRRA